MGTRVKSIFCFVTASEFKRQGIATKLLERVCKDALHDGFDIVEAYPYQESSRQSSDFGGYFGIYKKSEFDVFLGSLRHGDFHFANLIKTDQDIFIIDWVDATLGSPEADLCRSFLIYKLHSPEGFADIYLDLCCKKQIRRVAIYSNGCR